MEKKETVKKRERKILGERRGKRQREAEVGTHRGGVDLTGFILEDKNVW